MSENWENEFRFKCNQHWDDGGLMEKEGFLAVDCVKRYIKNNFIHKFDVIKTAYKLINPKIEEVGFWEETETYYVVGDVGSEEAMKAVIIYELLECGLSPYEGVTCNPFDYEKQLKSGSFTTSGEWIKFHEGKDVGKKGWLLHI